MIIDGDGARDLLSLVVPGIGALEATGNPFEPYRLVDAGGVIVAPVAAYLGDLQACGRPAATQRSYGMLCRYLICSSNKDSSMFSQFRAVAYASVTVA